MINLKDLTIDELKTLLEKMGEKPFRGKQIFQWIYKGAEDFSQMTNLSEALREKLQETATINSLQILRVQNSKSDGTRKYLLELEDGNSIESVFMKYKYGNSICISSQAGCKMGCKFCASSIGGLQRNLTSGEMVDQILTIQRDTGEKINHVVIMGTGEPFDNYDNVKKFIQQINCSDGLNLGMRNITVSTCGIIPMIEQFAEDFDQVNLAISLHSADDVTREKMMPINNLYPVDPLLQACRDYTKKTGRRITFEYALVKGVNDTKKQIDLLAAKTRGMLCHINLIPLNQVSDSELSGTGRHQAAEIGQYLENRGLTATVRRELGADIDAACGQLRLGKK